MILPLPVILYLLAAALRVFNLGTFLTWFQKSALLDYHNNFKIINTHLSKFKLILTLALVGTGLAIAADMVDCNSF